MKITDIETFLVAPRWLFCKVSTDEGIAGWGEPVVEGRAETVRTAVHELAPLLLGADPLRLEDNWQVMTKGTFYRGGPVLSSAVAGLDQALWDIAGKVRDAPVHELLGGPVRESVRVYSWVGGDQPSELQDAIQRQVDLGFTAVKMNASGPVGPIATVTELERIVRRAEVARELLGPDRDLALDFHGRLSPANARRVLARLDGIGPLFVEEPLLPEYSDQLAGLVAATSVPIATGERLYGRHEFLRPLEAGVAVVQPDISHAGGISEVRRIGALAEMFGAALAPHCPLGPIALAASLQVALATPNFLIQEQSQGIHYNADVSLLDYLVDSSVLSFAGGSVPRPTGPGLGIQVDESEVRAADRVGHAWHPPIWRHPDGSFAEW